MMNTCATNGCTGSVVARGLCRSCYGKQWHQQRSADPEYGERRRENHRRLRSNPEYRERERRAGRERWHDKKLDPTYLEQHHERQRQYALKGKYNLTPDQYSAMLESQGGRCAICGKLPSGTGRNGLAIDHCHNTAAVRGLLCFDCNTGLGKLGDTAEALECALAYLRGQQ